MLMFLAGYAVCFGCVYLDWRYRLGRYAGPSAATPQPPPVKTSGESIHDLVVADIGARKEFGVKKYGTTLQAGNGRDQLLDAYQEALDLVVYLKAALVERDAVGTAHETVDETEEA